ncbi:MAG: iron-sulfur cluster assembly scaffold protein [candidate division KSB1 bacterium]|jgi:nitrogen fixation NifU-like protein|nr:iron-sulfur cluster assembly scaffold protein [candidate division KSB1 bacterium]
MTMQDNVQSSHIVDNEKIVDHFLNPRNIGEIENPDGHAVVGDPSCGDHIKVWIRVQDEIITDFKYKVFGCWGAISTTSVISELAIGKTLREAVTLSDDDVIRALGGIPENKKHCSLLGVQGLKAAIAEFLVNDNHRKYQSRIDLYRSQGYDIPLLRDRMVQFLGEEPAEGPVLDVGTGKGHLALAIAKTGRRCVSIDVSETELSYAKLNAIYYRLDELIKFKIQDAKALPFEPHSYDAVMSAALLHHLINPQHVLSEMIRVCASNGKIIISDLNEQGLILLEQILKKEGKDHCAMGWSLDKVKAWFENRGLHVDRHNGELENMLVIDLSHG